MPTIGQTKCQVACGQDAKKSCVDRHGRKSSPTQLTSRRLFVSQNAKHLRRIGHSGARLQSASSDTNNPPFARRSARDRANRHHHQTRKNRKLLTRRCAESAFYKIKTFPGGGTFCRKLGTPARQKTAKSGRPTFRNFKLYHYQILGFLDETTLRLPKDRLRSEVAVQFEIPESRTVTLGRLLSGRSA